MIIMTCLPAFTTHAYHKTADSQVWVKTWNSSFCGSKAEVDTTTVTHWADGSYERSVSDLTCLYEAHESVCTTVTTYKITYAPGDILTGKSYVISRQSDD
jgi:hypothetical protein